MNPLVSIITPTCNSEKFISETIRCVLSQTYPHWEMILCDDASTDKTKEIISGFQNQDSRIHLIESSTRNGPALSRQKALEKASGEYVCFLDSDDLWLPKKLEVQLSLMQTYQWVFSFTSYRRINSDGKKVGRLITVPSVVSYEQLLKHNVIATLTTMVNQRKVGKLRMVNEGYDDYILWLSILKRGFVAQGIQADLARYRVVGSSSVSGKRFRSASWVWNIYKNVEKLPMHKAFWYFSHYSVRTTLKHSKF